MRKFHVTVNGKAYQVEVEEVTGGEFAPAPAVAAAPVAAPAPAAVPAPVAAVTPAPVPASQGAQGSEVITAPLAGTIVGVLVAPGEAVKQGQVLFIIEALKMENEILSPADGVVATVTTSKGQAVLSGAVLGSLNAQ